MKGNFNQLINGSKPVLIDFYADWCGPCKVLTPILKEVAEELGDEIRVVKIDVDRNQSIAQRYQVRGIPTMALFKDGKIVWRTSGVQSKQQIVHSVRENLSVAS